MERAYVSHATCSSAPIISCPEYFQSIRARWARRYFNIDGFTNAHTLLGAIPFNPRRAITTAVHSHSGQLPIGTTRQLVFEDDWIARVRNLLRVNVAIRSNQHSHDQTALKHRTIPTRIALHTFTPITHSSTTAERRATMLINLQSSTVNRCSVRYIQRIVIGPSQNTRG